MAAASATTRGRQKARMPRAISTPRPIIAVWSPRSNRPEFSKPVEPCNPKLSAVKSTTTTPAEMPATQRILRGRYVTVVSSTVTRLPTAPATRNRTGAASQPAVRDVGDQDGAGTELVQLVHGAVHRGAPDHRLD